MSGRSPQRLLVVAAHSRDVRGARRLVVGLAGLVDGGGARRDETSALGVFPGVPVLAPALRGP
ncbi:MULTISPECIES: hypothetical protein [Actinoalloteichus]|uniref:Uncharacterized protein n=1 Tax=Actinoalloteichus caeruleus DSM 43889 TaxID=1120930 RepID=A0ABT1JLK9_ACTCY|nr:hypothetical protein [Actinoalloteichus caeruleus]MCP2333390.1 hypothetical protein [Actinoalloteichus caeruleus DSM 43889]